MKITVTPNPNHGMLPASDKLGFGTVFTDHMFLMGLHRLRRLAQRAHRPLRSHFRLARGKRSALRHRGL